MQVVARLWWSDNFWVSIAMVKIKLKVEDG